MKNFIRYFIQGLLVIVPIAITAIVIVKLFQFIISLFGDFGVIVNPVIDPFIVLALVIILIFLAGLMSTSLFLKPIFTVFEYGMEKAPLVKIIYSSIKDFLSAFVGSKKRFNKPVLVTINKDTGTQQMGFVTQNDLSDLGLGKEKAAVYIPFSYAFTGKLIIVSKDLIVPLDIPAAEAMKFIVSGGVSEID